MNTKCMLCSKLLVAHVPQPNNFVYFPLLISLTFWLSGAHVAYNQF